MKTEVNSVSVPWTRKWFPPMLNDDTCPGLCKIVFKNFTWYLKFELYHAVILIVLDTSDFYIFMPKLCSGGFNFRTYFLVSYVKCVFMYIYVWFLYIVSARLSVGYKIDLSGDTKVMEVNNHNKDQWTLLKHCFYFKCIYVHTFFCESTLAMQCLRI